MQRLAVQFTSAVLVLLSKEEGERDTGRRAFENKIWFW